LFFLLILALYFKSLSFAIMKMALANTIKTTVMISFIIAGAGFLSQVVGFLGIATSALSEFIASLGLTPLMLDRGGGVDVHHLRDDVGWYLYGGHDLAHRASHRHIGRV
jgi:predicted Kef-type K+ transport protein